MNKKVFLLIGALLSTTTFAATNQKCPLTPSDAVNNQGWVLVKGEIVNIDDYKIQTTTIQPIIKQPNQGKMGSIRANQFTITCKYSYTKSNGDNTVYFTEVQKTFNAYVSFKNGNDWSPYEQEVSAIAQKHTLMKCSGSECYFNVEQIPGAKPATR